MQVSMQWVESQQRKPGGNGMTGIHYRGILPTVSLPSRDRSRIPFHFIRATCYLLYVN